MNVSSKPVVVAKLTTPQGDTLFGSMSMVLSESDTAVAPAVWPVVKLKSVNALVRATFQSMALTVYG